MNEDDRQPFWVRCGDTTPRDRRNLMRVVWTLAAWAAGSPLALASQADGDDKAEKADVVLVRVDLKEPVLDGRVVVKCSSDSHP